MSKTPSGLFAARDAADLRLAKRELDAGTEALAAAHAVVDRGDRTAAIRAAVAKLALSARFIVQLVERRGGAEFLLSDVSVADADGNFPPLAE